MQNIREVLRNTDITNYKFASFAFTLLASTCCIALGTGVSYNVTVLQGIGSEEVQQFYGIAASSFQSFEWSYICPSLVFPFICGFMIDTSIGLRWSLHVFYGTCLIGQLVWLAASLFGQYAFHVALIGFLIMGIGISGTLTAQYTVSARFYVGKYLTTLVALIYIFRYLSFLCSLHISKSITQRYYKPGYAILFGTFILLFTFLYVILLFILLKIGKRGKIASPRDLKTPVLFQCITLLIVNIVSIFNLTSIQVVYYYFSDVLVADYNVSSSDIDLINAIVLVYFILLYLVGALFVDISGYQILWLNGGSLLFTISIFLFNWATSIPYYITIAVMGIGMSFSTFPLVSLIPFVLKKKFWGRGYSTIIVSTSLAYLLPQVIKNNTTTSESQTIACVCTIIGFIFILILNFIDYYYKRILNKSSREWHDLMWSNYSLVEY